jgi:hypothetical protein
MMHGQKNTNISKLMICPSSLYCFLYVHPEFVTDKTLMLADEQCTTDGADEECTTDGGD